jgi:hypothetical protein
MQCNVAEMSATQSARMAHASRIVRGPLARRTSWLAADDKPGQEQITARVDRELERLRSNDAEEGSEIYVHSYRTTH